MAVQSGYSYIPAAASASARGVDHGVRLANLNIRGEEPAVERSVRLIFYSGAQAVDEARGVKGTPPIENASKRECY